MFVVYTLKPRLCSFILLFMSVLCEISRRPDEEENMASIVERVLAGS